MFDEEPDGDPHGECAAEIEKLREALGWIRRYLVEVNRGYPNECSAIDLGIIEHIDGALRTTDY